MLTPSQVFFGLTLLALLIWVFAFWRGGAAERWGAAIIMANQLLTTVFVVLERSRPGPINMLVQLTLDGVTAVALLLILLRFGRAWLGVAMLLYAAQFTLQSVYLVAELKKDALHVYLNNLDFIAVHISLVVGTLQHWRRSARAAAAP
jgi:hypothetical protein